MQIDSLEIGNFRNYELGKIEFHSGTNVLYGDNAQGKTNLLEAIFVCGTSRSHKGSKDKDLIRIGQEESHIRMYFRKKGIKHRIDMHLKRNDSCYFLFAGGFKDYKKRSFREEKIYQYGVMSA